ncbi:hypothetical protein [Papillibacter cinnamivorans]|uniref:Uncharacterized protein n=1 Tax=Papillibacter cinnamivorans DSM 12816 TaxID=1122930 RepID=A0A1W1YEZ9_9FIRM|nr:hypothetical protein [Papillibacter cinnamivorans]SMC34735.1 hypothetical protein SAMN02745168_0388 [Papillibacter cinnamivorans DSM 12816]
MNEKETSPSASPFSPGERENKPDLPLELYEIASCVMEFVAEIDRDFEKEKETQ